MDTIKLLLVEDNPVDVTLFQKLLKKGKSGMYEIDVVGSLADALRALRRRKADAVILDLNLPDSKGFDTFRALRLDNPQAAIIVLTGEDDERMALQAVQAGAQDYIVKGELNDKSLGRAIRYAIERQSAETRISQLNSDLEKRIIELAGKNKELDKLSSILKLARDQALQAATFRSEFVAKMSHEIRTPIAAILGTMELLETTELTDEQRDLVQIVTASADSLLKVINEVLDYSKLESGEVELETKDFSPVRVIEGTADLVSDAAASKGLSMMSFIDPGVPEMLKGDPVRIRQILLNFLGNAIKFTNRGEITVQATREAFDESTYVIRFSVMDTGSGLSEEDIAQLFGPYAQIADGHTGLGLAISKRLIELMGGQIGVESEEGRGSTFWFSLRMTRSGKKFVDSLPLPSMASELVGLRVLVADDNKSTRYIMQTYLKAARFQVSTAASGDEALEMLRHAKQSELPYSVAIIGLTRGDGSVKLAHEIQEDPTISRTRLIYLSPTNNLGTGDELWQKGFTSYLSKPVRQASLIASVLDVMYGNYDTEVEIPESEDTSEFELNDEAKGVVPSAPKSILVAEDNKFLQQVLKRTLKLLGYKCDIAKNGTEAVSKHAKGDYALILMDCQMPLMDGYEATKKIREKEAPEKKHTPIVAMTASTQKAVRDKCFDCGMDHFLAKPVTMEHLQQVIAVLSKSAFLPLDEATENLDKKEE